MTTFSLGFGERAYLSLTQAEPAIAAAPTTSLPMGLPAELCTGLGDDRIAGQVRDDRPPRPEPRVVRRHRSGSTPRARWSSYLRMRWRLLAGQPLGARRGAARSADRHPG